MPYYFRYSSRVLNQFTDNLPDHLESYRKYDPTLANLKAVLHVMDMDGDYIDDVVYNGWEGEKRQLVIYLNRDTSFEKVFEGWQTFTYVTFNEGGLAGFALKDNGCCGETVIHTRTYAASKEENMPAFTETGTYQYLDTAHLPKTWWPSAKVIETTTDSYNLRNSPAIDDTGLYYYGGPEPTAGNTVAKLPKGTKATALAELADSAGRVWYFVAVHPEYKLTNSFFYDEEQPPAYKCGWVSSNFVKIHE